MTETIGIDNFEKIYKDMRAAGWSVDKINELLKNTENDYMQNKTKIATARENMLTMLVTYLKAINPNITNKDLSTIIDDFRGNLCKIEKDLTTAQKIEIHNVKNRKSDSEIIEDFFKTIGLV